MELTLKREFSYYMLTIYVPTCMLVIVSWFSFWIDPKVFQKKVHRTKSINKLSNNNFFLGSASQGGPGGDHLAGHVHHHGLHPAQPAPSRLHQSCRRLVRRLRLLRLQCSPRIRPRQLCLEVNLVCCNSLTAAAAWQAVPQNDRW